MKNLKITNPDKILFPEDNITKMDIAMYYLEISEQMLKFACERVLSVIRCHESIEKEKFRSIYP
jgi:bifunctional non-homologous end joining protein LigD